MRHLLTVLLLATIVALGASSQPWKEAAMSTAQESGPYELHQFESVEKKLKKLPRGSLLVLDCTKTLVTPKDPILKVGHWSRTLERIMGRAPCAEEVRRLKLLAEMQVEKELVHPRWPSLLSELAEGGVRILVLTKHPTGQQISGLPSFEELRAKRLQDLGFRFQKWAPPLDSERVQMLLPGREVGIYQGVVFAPDGEKGPVLEALIESLPELPKAIAVVDDSFAQAQSMATTLREIAIPSQVLLYRDQTAQTPPELSPRDEQRLREFLSSGVWSE
jgi:hypothetical protein